MPKRGEDGCKSAPWSVSAQPDSRLVEKDTHLQLSYLFWEAESNILPPPNLGLSPADAWTDFEYFDAVYRVLDCDIPMAVLL